MDRTQGLIWYRRMGRSVAAYQHVGQAEGNNQSGHSGRSKTVPFVARGLENVARGLEEKHSQGCGKVQGEAQGGGRQRNKVGWSASHSSGENHNWGWHSAVLL